MNYNSIFFIAVVLIFVPFAIWMQYQTNQRAIKNFNVFYAAEIDSYVAHVDIAHHGTLLILEDGRDFIFYPLTDKLLNSGRKFNHTAEKGDKVVKASYTDTLYLIQADQKLAYTFRKFD